MMFPRTRHPALLLLLVMMLAAPGCLKKKAITGKEFIQPDVLVNVLVDIHLMDAMTNDRKFHRRYEADSIDLFSPILEKYGVTQQMFDTTMYEYSRYPELLDQIYSEVLIKLNVMLDENDQDEGVSTQVE